MGWQTYKGAGKAGGNCYWRCECGSVQGVQGMHRAFCRGCNGHYREVQWNTHKYDKGYAWKPPSVNQWEQGPPRVQTTKPTNTESTAKQAAPITVMDAIKVLFGALPDNEEHREARQVLQHLGTKQKAEEPAQVKQDKVKSLGDKWDHMDKHKEDEAAAAQVEEQLKVVRTTIKERKTKMSGVRAEFDAAVAELN